MFEIWELWDLVPNLNDSGLDAIVTINGEHQTTVRLASNLHVEDKNDYFGRCTNEKSDLVNE